jgi:IPT/TIG domain
MPPPSAPPAINSGFQGEAANATRPPPRFADRLGLSVLASVASTAVVAVLSTSPQFKLVAASAGAGLSAIVTEPGRFRRQRALAAALLTVVALFVTYGGATAFSYAAHRAPIYPGQPAPAYTRPAPSVSPSPATSVSPSPTPSVSSSPAPSPSQSSSPGGPADGSGLSPVSGSAAGGGTVTITGSGFTGATAVLFGGTGAQFNVDSDSQITAISPAGTGTVVVTVITADQPAGISAGVFTYLPGGGITPGGSNSPDSPSPSSSPDITPSATASQ